MAKQSTGLYIEDSLSTQIGLFARRHKWSWNQGATVLLERGLEAQPSEVADLVTAAQEAIAEMELTHGVFESPNLLEAIEMLRAALAPFAEVGGE